MEKEYKIPLQHSLCKDLSYTDKFHMPKVKPYTGPIPTEVISFNRARAMSSGKPDAAVHFYIQDVFFNCVWNAPEKYVKMFQRFWGIISTDYSVYADMVMPEVMWNSFRNKLLAAWLQSQGINVIPNVSWGRSWSHELCIDGFPKHSVIAINSTGIGTDSFSKSLWLQGYRKVLESLEPLKVIRYGAKQDGEDESISIFFPNDNYKSVCYGR